MAKRSWQIDLSDGPHTVELEHGYWSGRRVVRIDGRMVIEEQKWFDTGSVYPFEIGPHSVVVRITTNGFTFGYDLVVDGTSVVTGQSVAANVPPSRFVLTRERLEKALKQAGWILIVAAVLHLLTPDLFSRLFGLVLAGTGLVALRYPKPKVLLLLGAVQLGVGVYDLLHVTTAGGWNLFAYLQIGLGVGQISFYFWYTDT